MMPKSYDAQKTWRGRTYTGMKVGRGHKWDYEGQWVERKLGPDLWDFSFTATKRRKGRGAPEGSGVPVGTEYHWFFVPTSQIARKMDANSYALQMEGLKWKLGFRPATSKSWDHEWAKTGETARQRAIRILEQTLADLKADEREGGAPLEAPHLAGERPVPPKRSRAKTAAKKAAKAPAKKRAAKKPARKKSVAKKAASSASRSDKASA